MQDKQPTEQQPPEWWKQAKPAAQLVGAMFEEAQKAADDWVNSGWSVKKRAGQVLPELRPNAADIGERSTQFLDGEAPAPMRRAGAPPHVAAEDGPAGAIEISGVGAITTETDSQLQGEFMGYLTVLEEREAFVEGPNGEVTFASREALAGVVAGFTFAKLRELAAATKALARYVDDLEAELEEADEAVLEVRKEMLAFQKKQRAAEAELAELRASQAATRRELAEAAEAAEAQRAARARAEAEADAAAERLLQVQGKLKDAVTAERDAAAAAAAAAESAAEAELRAARGRLSDMGAESELASAEAQGRAQAEAEARAAAARERMELVKLEEKLMAAEEASGEEEARRRRLEQSLQEVVEQQAKAQAAGAAEAARAAELEQRAAAAEAEAERKAAQLSSQLSASQAEVEQLQAALGALQKVAQEPANGKAAPKNGAAAAAAPKNGAAATAAPKNGAAATAASPSAAPATPAAPGAAAAPAAAPAAASSFEAEAAQLEADLARLAGGGPSARPALSKMRKADLLAECEERGLEPARTVAELRAVLRVERKQDKKVEELEERGWSEKQGRAALAKAGWDLDEAIRQLLKA